MIQFDYIVPICNIDTDGWEQRLNNLAALCDIIPPNVHLILVEQVVSLELLKYTDNLVIPKKVKATVKVVNYPVFNKPWLFNCGVRLSKTNKLMLAEMDVLFGDRYIDRLTEVVWKNWFFGWDNLVFWNKDETYPDKLATPQKTLTEGGIVCVTKNFYWKIGGGNEWIQSLGGPDNEFIRRAEFVSKSYTTFPHTIYHKWHPRHKLKVGEEWKNNRHRLRNKEICSIVSNKPNKMIDLLRDNIKSLGRAACPICKNVPDDFVEKYRDYTKLWTSFIDSLIRR